MGYWCMFCILRRQGERVECVVVVAVWSLTRKRLTRVRRGRLVGEGSGGRNTIFKEVKQNRKWTLVQCYIWFQLFMKICIARKMKSLDVLMTRYWYKNMKK